MQPLVIRYSQAADLAGLFKIDQEIWTPLNSPGPFLSQTLRDYQQHYPVGSQLVAVRGHTVLGMISWNPASPYPSMHRTWDIGIGVAKTAQHQGVGKQLMTGLKREARRRGIHRIQLNVLATNVAARQFYAQQGFQVESCARDAFFIDGHYVDDYGLAYLLKP